MPGHLAQPPVTALFRQPQHSPRPSLPPRTHGSEDTEPELGHQPEAPRQAGPRRSSLLRADSAAGSQGRGFALPLCPALAPLGLSVGHPLALDFRLAEVGSAGHPPAMQACPSRSEPSSAGGWSARREELPDLGGVQGRLRGSPLAIPHLSTPKHLRLLSAQYLEKGEDQVRGLVLLPPQSTLKLPSLPLSATLLPTTWPFLPTDPSRGTEAAP